jgi:hypothetical protein
MKIPLSFGHTEKFSKNVNAGKCISMMPVVNHSDSKNQITLSQTSGLEQWVELSKGPVRGMLVRLGVIYAVAGDTFYSLNVAAETATTIGTIQSSSGKVWMEYNGIYGSKSTWQIMICDGTDGYYFDGVSTLAPITDEDFPGCSSMSFVDQYGIISEPETGNLWNSNLNDFSAWLGSDFVVSEGAPDNLLSVIADHREAWLFGERTVEVFKTTGDTDAVFQRINGTFQEIGIAAAASPAKKDNVIFWLDNYLQVRMASGYNSSIVSTPAISNLIQNLSVTSDAIGMAYIQNGQTFYVLTFPSSNLTIAYDHGESVKAGFPLWHVKSSGTNGAKWRGSCVVEHNGTVFVGDSQNGYIHKLKDNVYTDNGEAIRREFTTQEVFDQDERRNLFHHELELEVESGVGLVTGQGSDPEIMMQYSDDGGHTWSYESWSKIGKIGEYANRVRWQGLGQSRNRIYKFALTDSINLQIVSAYVKASRGTE